MNRDRSLHKNQIVDAAKAKTLLGRLLRRVGRGESFVITRRGAPLARLVPFEVRTDTEAIDRALEDIEELSKGRSLSGLSIKQMIEEGRR